MKHITWLLVFVLVGCKQKEPVLSVNANQLLGTWTSSSTNFDARPFMRWTFKPDSVYVAYDALTVCQPVDNSSTSLYRYSLEEDKLIMVYWGISVGPGFYPSLAGYSPSQQTSWSWMLPARYLKSVHEIWISPLKRF